MGSVAEHLKRHGAVHALWIIAVLLFVIAALILMRPNGDAVGQYIAFATSLASLILALVAIGQVLISSQSFSETIGSLKSSAENIDLGAKNVAETSIQLVEHSSSLLGEVRQVPSALSALSKRVTEAISQASSTSVVPSGATEGLSVTYGGALALYILAVACNKEKSFSVENIFDGHPSKTIWASLVVGFLFSVRTFKPCGIELSVTGEKVRILNVDSLGSLDPEKLIESFKKFQDNEAERKFVDAYFEKTTTSSAEASANQKEPPGTN